MYRFSSAVEGLWLSSGEEVIVIIIQENFGHLRSCNNNLV